MMRLIDADDLLTAFPVDDEPTLTKSCVRMTIQRMPTIEPRKGKWIYGEDEYGIDGYHCDKCGFFVPWDYAHKFINYIEDYNFCPNCGADMRGEQDGKAD